MENIEKATLKVTTGKNNKLSIIVDFGQGKTMPAPFLSNPTKVELLALDGQEVQIGREKGVIVRIVHNNRTLYNKVNSTNNSNIYKDQNRDSKWNNNRTQTNVVKATAPYNFIPLNETVVPCEKKPVFAGYEPERKTGYIEVTVETKTPTYIRNVKTQDDLGKGEDFIVSDFFSPAGKHRIPGSSFRGLIRTMVEILSYSRMKFVDDKKLYYRAVGDMSKLGDSYRDMMFDTEDNYYPKIEAGFISKNGRDYYITPSKVIRETQFYRVNYNPKNRKVGDFSIPEFAFKEVWFKPVRPENHVHFRPDKYGNRKEYMLKYALIETITTIPSDKLEKGYLVSSGDLGNKKHLHWVINIADTEHSGYRIAEEVIASYKNDESRNIKEFDLLKQLRHKPQSSIPCFYLQTNQDIEVFGHTGLFRLPYVKSISDFLTSQHHTVKGDIAEGIFGNQDSFKGRVSFEDISLTEDSKQYITNSDVSPKILSGPKPTAFQLYLKQDPSSSIKIIINYNDEGQLRGYKQYWHRDTDYREKDQSIINKHKSQYTKIKPIDKGACFKGKIRFENLSSVELGALLSALKLKDNLCHKIGMGKPLGMGSIKVTPQLFISDRKQRYMDILAEFESIPEQSAEIDICIAEFEKYVLENIGEKSKTTIWDTDRIKQLECMLNWDKKPEPNDTEYMTLESKRFSHREMLHKPEDYVDKKV